MSQEFVERAVVEEMDAILGWKIPVGESGGWIRAIDYMGDDAAVVQAARQSYGKGTKSVREDRGLIRYLLRNWHTTPFEMCEVKFHIMVPMDTWRQWIRHRTASVNEYSTRYSQALEEMAATAPGEWRLQSAMNKQGSGKFIDDPEVQQSLSDVEADFHAMSRTVYEQRLEHGVAREQARKDLPLSTFTMAYWKIDLHNLFHFLRLRMDSHAQKEIRDYAQAMYAVVQKWVPLCAEAFEDYRLRAKAMSGMEMDILRNIFRSATSTQGRREQTYALIDEACGDMSKRELRDFYAKVGISGDVDG